MLLCHRRLLGQLSTGCHLEGMYAHCHVHVVVSCCIYAYECARQVLGVHASSVPNQANVADHNNMTIWMMHTDVHCDHRNSHP